MCLMQSTCIIDVCESVSNDAAQFSFDYRYIGFVRLNYKVFFF